jgi:hypothetical protein
VLSRFSQSLLSLRSSLTRERIAEAFLSFQSSRLYGKRNLTRLAAVA